MSKALKDLTPEEKAQRDLLRAKTVESPALTPSKMVEWDGALYELRAPSLRVQDRMQRMGKDKDGQNNMRMMFMSLIECVFLPGTDIPVFEPADEAGFADRTLKDFVGVFTKAILSLAGEADLDVAEKNSESAPTEGR